LAVSGIRDAADRIVGAVSIARDVTREQALEEQLRQAHRMEAIGQLAGGIAHDFNNLLTAVSGYAELLTEELGPGEPTTEYVTEIAGAARRGADLVRQLLAFARKQQLAPVVADVNAVVASLTPMLSRLIGEHIEVRTNLGEDVGHIEVDRSQFEQAIVNLAVNARDAMPGGGILTIETERVRIVGAEVSAHGEIEPGDYARISVSDTGIGMDGPTRERAFEPFFTTKEPGKGTGLGLATVYGIVHQSRGRVWLYSEPGHGTVFRLHFPRTTRAATFADDARERPVPGGHESILLVEDEGSVRALARRILENNGYRVVDAASGPEALEALRQQPRPIDALITDFVMPGMTGPQLAERLAEEFGLDRVLFMSGYTAEALPRRTGRTGYLAKPFSPTDLLLELRRVLAGG
jgi:nitrogen-specific signal transduction histidine kinase